MQDHCFSDARDFALYHKSEHVHFYDRIKNRSCQERSQEKLLFLPQLATARLPEKDTEQLLVHSAIEETGLTAAAESHIIRKSKTWEEREWNRHNRPGPRRRRS